MFTRNEIDEKLPTPKRRHHPWHEMEEYRPHGGMWATCEPAVRLSLQSAAADLLCDVPRFMAAIRRLAEEWPNSTEVCLTTSGMNQRAWFGQAACYLLASVPQEVTRLAWHTLTARQQTAANAAVDAVLAEWDAARAEEEGLF